MTTKDFVMWLQGYLEVSEATSISEEQLKKIKAKMNEVDFEAKTQQSSSSGSSGGQTFRC